VEKELNVAYVVVMFPCYSETFVLRELLELRRRGARLTILSLRRFSERIVDDDARPLLPATVYSPYILSTRLLAANLRCLLRRPLRYARSRVRWIRRGRRRAGIRSGRRN